MSTVVGRPSVALATSVDWPDLSPDDGLIAPALARVGVDAEIAIWTEPRVAWVRYDLIVVRSCWDYHQDLPRWLDWIGALERRGCGMKLCNPPAVLRWNARKTYLRELAARGVSVVPTVWLAGADLASWDALKAALEATPWDEVVCKPAVAAGALATFRLPRANFAAFESVVSLALPDYVSRGPVMIQPYLSEIARDGEWSLIFFAGAFSHAVLKQPAMGDFRVQERHGGSTVAATPPALVMAAARATLAATNQTLSHGSDGALLYARVDMVVSAGTPLLIELEITEPALFLGTAAASETTDVAADRLADAIAGRIAAGVAC